MKYLLINSHPYDGSFAFSAINQMAKTATEKGHDVTIIDLVKEGFNPVMSEKDLKLWGQGTTDCPLTKKYMDDIKNADILVFHFPIWWGMMPAVLKGFCDKVLLPGFAYKYGEQGEMIGLLTNKKAIVITTMETPVEIAKNFLNNPVEGSFVKNTLATCGMEVTDFLQIDKIVTGGREYTQQKLQEIKSLIK